MNGKWKNLSVEGPEENGGRKKLMGKASVTNTSPFTAGQQ